MPVKIFLPEFIGYPIRYYYPDYTKVSGLQFRDARIVRSYVMLEYPDSVRIDVRVRLMDSIPEQTLHCIRFFPVGDTEDMSSLEIRAQQANILYFWTWFPGGPVKDWNPEDENRFTTIAQMF